jgi:hypothetical protein
METLTGPLLIIVAAFEAHYSLPISVDFWWQWWWWGDELEIQ